MSVLTVGSLVAGDFRILRPLNAGGMGAVYVALQLSTNRERALKVMLGELASNDDLKSRFVQEATIGSQIDSDHAVEVIAAGIDQATGTPWLAMELLDGEDLASFLAKSGPMSPAWILDLFEQMTHALGAAHHKGIVHRDLKPENIFLARSRRANSSFMVKVLDFGIAKLLGVAKSSATAAIGTPLWMAPEQTQASHAIAPAADVWSMGLIAFRALTGRIFWRTATDPNASSMMILREVVFEALPPASQRAAELGAGPLPYGFDAWFARCVQRDPAMRYPDATAMLAELRTVLGSVAAAQVAYMPSAPVANAPQMAAVAMSAPMPALSFVTVPPVVPSNTGSEPHAMRPPPPPPPARRKKSSSGLYALLGLGAIGVVVGGIALATSRSTPKRPERAPSSKVAPTKLAAPAPETPFAPTQAWVGTYLCGQGRTAVTLRIEGVVARTVNAIFDFQVPNGTTGSFRMSGPYDPATRKLNLKAGAWIKQPPNYETVNMDGVVSPDGSTYSGRMLNPRCSTFNVRLDPTAGPGGPAPIAPTPAYPPSPPASPPPAAPDEPTP